MISIDDQLRLLSRRCERILSEADLRTKLARSAATFPWSTTSATDLLRHLASNGAGIARLTDSQRRLRRAQVLAQALDRILVQLHNQQTDFPGAADKLNVLFADLHGGDGFDAALFCRDLAAFSSTLGKS